MYISNIKSAVIVYISWIITLLIIISTFSNNHVKAAETDRGIPAYKWNHNISGDIFTVGSDTMNNQMALWCEGFTKYYPKVRCLIEGKGSATAPPALISGTPCNTNYL